MTLRVYNQGHQKGRIDSVDTPIHLIEAKKSEPSESGRAFFVHERSEGTGSTLLPHFHPPKTMKKIYEMNDQEFREYIEEVRKALEDYTAEELMGFAQAPIATKDLGQWPTHKSEEATEQ